MKRIFHLISFVLIVQSLYSQGTKELTLKEIWASPTFRPEYIFGIASMKDGIHYSSLSADEGGLKIEKHAYATSQKVADILVANEVKLPNGQAIEFDDYIFNEDETMILVATESEPIYRYSTRSRYVVVDLKSKKATYVSSGKQHYAGFSPDGKQVAFVKENNLFIKDLVSEKETQITKDGLQNSIINGASDWVYEEEFALKEAFFWSPDNSKIAFLRFDESKVQEFSMSTYGELYPRVYKFKYPKAGEDNSSVSLKVYDLQAGKTTTMEVGNDMNQYLPRVKWNFNGSQLSVVRLNRHQNHLELLLCNPSNGEVKTLLEEKSETYIDINDNLTFLKDGKRFIWSSELGGFNHLYLYGMDGKKINAISSGNMDLTEFYGLDEKKGLVYFQSAAPTPMDRSIYVSNLNGKGQKVLVSGTGHQTPEFSKTFDFFVLTKSTANTPVSFEMYNGNGKLLRVLEANDKLKSTLGNYKTSTKEFFTFNTSTQNSLNGWMIKPPDFDARKKYPVFMTVYGGPGHNTVENQWEGANYLWYQMLAQKGYIVVSVDNRGTQFRGEAFKKSTYKQLGKLETEDQMEAAKYLAGLPFVEGSRIGIQGWSYGGYMSSLCITKGADLFKMAIAVAPVTNWRYYDSIYTERFMQTPKENASGYDDNSPINHVARLKGKYLLIHGTADDNVHFQNSAEMVTALVKANKQFDVFYYPDKNHGIYGGNTRLHLYTMMTDYILKNL
jgi:dipeptidyl-peptidase-4